MSVLGLMLAYSDFKVRSFFLCSDTFDGGFGDGVVTEEIRHSDQSDETESVCAYV